MENRSGLKFRGVVEGTEHVAYDPSFEMIWLEDEDQTFYAISDVLAGYCLRDGDVIELTCVSRTDGRFDCEGEYLEVVGFELKEAALHEGEEEEGDDDFDDLSDDELLAIGEKFLVKGSFKNLPK